MLCVSHCVVWLVLDPQIDTPYLVYKCIYTSNIYMTLHVGSIQQAARRGLTFRVTH